MLYVPKSRVHYAGLVDFQEVLPAYLSAVNNFLNGIYQSNYVLLERYFGSSVGEDKNLGLGNIV